jgi:hypothetical protein
MTIEQCARELANLLKSGQLPPPHQVSALINSCLRGVGARQMDLKRHQLAVAFKEIVPDSEQRDIILRRILPDDHDAPTSAYSVRGLRPIPVIRRRGSARLPCRDRARPAIVRHSSSSTFCIATRMPKGHR